MKKEKIMLHLVEDLFRNMLKEYGNPPTYIAYTNSNDPHTVAPIQILNAPSWATPGIGIDTTRGHTFTLYAIAPKEGYNEEIYGGILEINGSFDGSNILWMYPDDVVGPIGKVLHPDKATGKELDMLRIDCMKKALELFYSDQYDDNPQIKIPDKKLSVV